MRPRRLRTPHTPRTPRLPAPRSLSLTSDNSSPSTNSKRYSAGSQRRRRGRTTLTRSWHSALDNQLTEGRATSGRRAAARARSSASGGPGSASPTTTTDGCN